MWQTCDLDSHPSAFVDATITAMDFHHAGREVYQGRFIVR